MLTHRHDSCMLLFMKTYNLKDYIKKQGITQIEAAKQIGITRQYICESVNGRPAGRVLALRIEAWSNGAVKAANLILQR